MRMNLLLQLATMSVIALGMSSTARAQLGPNLVVNGSFEEPESDNRFGHNPATWFTGQSFSGWSVTQGSIDILRSGLFPGGGSNVGNGNAYEGRQYVDLNGTIGIGGIAQTITLTQPGVYRLSFAMSGNTGLLGDIHPNAPRPMRVRLAQGTSDIYNNIFVWDPANHLTHTGHGFDNAISYDWHQVDITVSAPGSYTLSFTSLFLEEEEAFGPVLDDVRFQLVPEPASMLALGAGLVGLLARRRLRP